VVEGSSKKGIEYIQSDFSPLNAHADGVVENEKQLARLKRFRADRFFFKSVCIFLIALGVFLILLSVAYYIYRVYPYSAITTTEPIYQTIDKPVYIDRPVIKEVEVPGPPILKVVEKPIYIEKPVYKIVRIPDPNVSRVIEKPVYITKIIKVPIQITKREGVTQGFNFFNTKKVNVNGISNVVVGASYDSVNSLFPESQWCYATSLRSLGGNTYPQLTLADKEGLNPVKYRRINDDDAQAFGSKKETLESVKKQCKFFPNVPPVERSKGNNLLIESFPRKPPASLGKSGTGFYIDSNGYLLTNYHVISGCTSVWIEDKKGRVPGVILEKDKRLDLAVIKAKRAKTSFAKFSDNIRTGDDVMALGFPLGSKLGNEIKATKGNISALSGLNGDKDYLQFTAPIQAGNSGGPLLNEGGYVVGMNSATLVGEDFQNINFAIKGHSILRFLGKNSVGFVSGVFSKSLKSADLVVQGTQFTVQVLCPK